MNEQADLRIREKRIRRYGERVAAAAGGTPAEQAEIARKIEDEAWEAYFWCARRNVSATSPEVAIQMRKGGVAVCP